MGLQFYLGRTGTGKTRKIIEEIKTELKKNPLGEPIIYITPEQMSFQAESEQLSIVERDEISDEVDTEKNVFSNNDLISEVLKDEGIQGAIRAQVYSFTRLSWLVLGETGGMSIEHINKTGISMLLRKVLEDNKEELLIFKTVSNKHGFIEKLEGMITEYKRYAIDSDAMLSLSDQSNSPILADKLKDFALINTKLNEMIDGKYLDNEAYLNFLVDKIPQSEYLKKAKIYIDGFHGFTQLEENIIEKLMDVSKEVIVSLTLDKPYKNSVPENETLFRMSGETYNQIYKLAKSNAIEIKPDVILSTNERTKSVISLKHLEAQFESRPAIRYDGDNCAIEVVEAKNKRVEIEHISREILKCARNGYRFRDIIVLNRNGEQYSDIIENTFRDYNIPTFIDQKKSMINHPIIELVNGILDAILMDFTHESTFRAFKTNLFFKDENIVRNQDHLAILENYVLEHGIRGKKWFGKWEFRFNRGLGFESYEQSEEEMKIEQIIHEQRAIHFDPLFKLSKLLDRERNVRGFATEIFQFVESMNVDVKLQKLMEYAIEKGDIQLARKHEQAWSGFIELLDQTVTIFGNQEMCLKDFAMILKTGTESLEFSIVPPVIDHVIVGNLELSKPLNAKVVFIVGMNDGILPMKISEGGILTESERESLAGMGIRLSSYGLTKLYDEEFVAYMALNLAKEKIYFTYPIADDEGKSLLPSSYIKRVENIFPTLIDKRRIATDEVACLGEDEVLELISNAKPTVKFLVSELRLKVTTSEVLSPIWITIFNSLKDNHALSKDLAFTLQSLNFQNVSQDMNKEVASALYGQEISGSVSKIENFNKCPFSYFAKYGLQLKTRPIYNLEASHIGTLFHESIHIIDRILTEKNISWASLNKDQCRHLAEEAVSEIAPKIQGEILFSNSRMNYLKEKFSNIIEQSAFAMKMHAEKSEFKTFGHEVAFGEKGSFIPKFEIELNNDAKMKLRGRIDRIDYLSKGDEKYFNVIDYKSSARDIDYGEVYDGTALQMFTYLNVLQKNAVNLFGTEANPAGVTYFHLHNPLLKEVGDVGDVSLEAEMRKKFKMKGLLIDNFDVLKKMDNRLETQGTSDIIPIRMKKDGSYYKEVKVATRDEFSLITDHIEQAFVNAGNEILSGNATIKPYKSKKMDSCAYCDYKSVCAFDAKDTMNQTRKGTNHSFKSLLHTIKNERDDS